MMKTVFTALGLLLASLSFAQSSVEADIQSISRNRVKWLLEKQVDSLALLYDEASDSVHGNGMIKPAKEHLDDVRNGRPVYKSIDYKEASVTVFGTTAVLVGKGVFSISIFNQEMTQDMVFTEVYLKKNGQWKLIARQASQVQ